MPPPNPYAGKFVWDSWGWRPRGDFVWDPDEGQWEISGSNGPNNYQLFDSEAAAMAWGALQRRPEAGTGGTASAAAQAVPGDAGMPRPAGLPGQAALDAYVRSGGVLYDQAPSAAALGVQQPDDSDPATIEAFRRLLEMLRRSQRPRGAA